VTIERDGIFELLGSLPDAIQRSAGRGQPVTFPATSLPDDPARRRSVLALLNALGVQIADDGIPEAFRARVRAELEAAETRARALLGVARAGGIRIHRDRRCAGCGCPVNAATPGCRNCKARHGMRHLEARRRAEAAHAGGYGRAA
jgi:hypothetical protein